MRVGTKLTLAVGSTLIAVGIGYAAILVTIHHRYVETSLIGHAQRLATFFEAAYENGMPPDALIRTAARLGENEELLRLELDSAAGERIAFWQSADPRLSDIPAESGGAAPEQRLIRSGSTALLYDARRMGDGASLRMVLVFTPHDADLFANRNINVTTVILVTLLLLLVVSRVTRKNVALPLLRLSHSMTLFGKGDLAARCPGGGPGEIGELAENFNRMADTIAMQTQALVRDREYEHNIIQNVRSGIIGLDKTGRITTWNQPMTQRYGIADQDALGFSLTDFCPDLLPRIVTDNVNRLLSGSSARFDLVGLRHAGAHHGERVMDVRGQALVDENGQTYGAVLLVDDRTDEVQLTEQLRHADKLATVGQLAAGLAHEIGTPLNIISGRAEFVLKKLPESSDLRNHLERIVSQIDRISGIVSQMLVFARKRPPHKERLSVKELIAGVAELLSMQLSMARVVLKADVPDDLHLVADPDQLQQVIMNLLMNATQAMVCDGLITVQANALCVPSRGDATFVQIEVADTGPGIPEAILDRIFDPFFTTKEPGHGTGMGLTVSHGIVTAHGGWIKVESVPGQGSRFTVFLPQSPESASGSAHG